MKRRWISFDSEVTNKEARSIPELDRGILFQAMKNYGLGLDVGYRVDSYEDGIKRIRGQSQGRCQFFTEVESGDSILLVALVFYKKETQKAPKQKLETAKQRMRKYRDG